MIMFRRLLLLLSLCLTLLVPGFGFVTTAHAQVNTGLNAVGNTIVLSATDPRVIAANIINIALGLVGIILLSLILYAGFLWMTSGGDVEKVERAKTYIRNAIIGVAIVLSSWAIATFVINQLLQATGTGGGSAAGGGSGLGGGLGGSGASSAFQVRTLSPSGSISIRNVQVRFIFSRDVALGSATSSIHVLRASDSAPVDGTLSITGSIVTFTPTATCPAPNTDRNCFDADTEFIARADASLLSSAGQSLVCGGFAPSCEGRFTTGNVVDTAAPTASIRNPFTGQSVSVDDAVRILTHATDDSGISYVESFVDGASIGTGISTATSTPTAGDYEIVWDTTGVDLGRHELQSQAFDIDSNATRSSVVPVYVRPAYCFNGTLDGDETGLDCGGSCGACSGGSCTDAGACASGVCVASSCVVQPVITGVSPLDGRPGTLVTISGANFGTSTGRVMFSDGQEATVPAVCSAAGVSTWSPNQVVVAVPDAAVDGPIDLTNMQSALSDTTNNDQGPVLDNFNVNDAAHPGLCGASPSSGLPGERVDLIGAGLGPTSDRVFFNDRETTAFLSWGDAQISLNTPVISPGQYAVHAQTGGVDSNSVSYRILERGTGAVPVIDSVSPTAGPIGEYVTLQGRNFGTRVGRVMFRNAGGEEGVADVVFPTECSVSFWSDASVVVKVPSGIGGLGSTPVSAGSYQIYLVRQDTAASNSVGFDVNTDAPHPGICAIQPSAGPIGTGVDVIGERFGSSGRVTFKGAGDTRVEGFIQAGDYGASRITTEVPGGSETGSVIVESGGNESNQAPFTVRNCNEDATICSAAGETCCRSGSCSVGGTCPEVTLSAQYAWRSSTGIIPINPTVVEECTSALPASPSPWSARNGGNSACVNSDIVIRFNTHLNASTVSAAGPSATMLVSRCTGSGTDPCTATEAVTPIAGFPLVNTAGDGDALLYRPNLPDGLWAADATYQVILRTGITSDTGIPMLERADCGAGNSYCFQFSTRPSTDLCTVGAINVLPNPFEANAIGQEIDYQAFPRAADDACISLNGSTMDWNWHTIPAASAVPDGRASITNVRGSSGNVLDHQTGTAIAETGDIPVPMTAALNQSGSVVSGIANLFIRFIPPKVVAYGPNCDSACLNAAIWARFNVAMDPATMTASNITLYRCANENCRTYDPTSPIDLSDARIELRVAPGGDGTGPLNYLVVDPTHPGSAGTPVTLLEPGRFYKMTLHGGLSGMRSATQLPLTGVTDTVGFSWVFRVKSGENPRCTVDSVRVSPGRKIETAIGARQQFSAEALSGSNTCNKDGEPLISDMSYDWGSSDTSISKFINASGDGLIDTTNNLPAGCGKLCTPKGSDGVFGQTASCGNSLIETTDANYCRNAAGTGPCTLGATGCQTIHSESCKLLSGNSTGGEECDDGIANGPTGRCSDSCLWNPVSGGSCGNGILDPGEQCDEQVCDASGSCTQAPGCSDTCQLEGSSAGASVCGNGSIGDGEACDDGNRVNGDGCNSECLHEGSQTVNALCGNGSYEAGETCEKVAPYLPWPNPACNPTTCLKTGTTACGPGDTLCCGDGVVDPAEDCDDSNALNGDGCSSKCLKEGSSTDYSTPSFCGDGITGTGELCEATSGDGLLDSTQLAQIVGDADPDASGRMEATLSAAYDTKIGEGMHGLQCGFTEEASCTAAGTGLGNNGCCSARPVLTSFYPPADSTDTCRNVEISGIFNAKIDQASMQSNFIVAEETGGASCPDGSQNINDVPYMAGGGIQGWLANIWHHIKTFFVNIFGLKSAEAQLWCVGHASGRIILEPSGDGTRVRFQLSNALKPDTRYKVTFRGDSDLTDAIKQGIRSDKGVIVPADPLSASAGSFTWAFKTGPDICTVSDVRVRDTNVDSPNLFTKANETHTYVADILSLSPTGVAIPVSPVSEYGWSWQAWDSSKPDVLPLGASTDSPEATRSNVSSLEKNGSSYIYAGIRILHDEVNTPSSTGQVFRSSSLGTVMLCEQPWPDRTLAPFSDSDGSASLAAYTPAFVASGNYFNFSMLYCKDAGAPGPEGDLPPAQITGVSPTATDVSLGILRQYLLTFDTDHLRGDGIGIRIVQNPLHLSVSEWYASKGFTGQPEATTIDGYEALRDESTMYVAGTNVSDSTSGPVYSNIYILSYNPDAKDETKNIFDQFTKNFVLNVNIANNSMDSCVDGTDEPYVGADGSVVKCTADWECLNSDPGLHCASFKEKIQRDTKRIADFQSMSSRLESSFGREGQFPLLSDGTFVQTLSSSRWPSWQTTLSAAVGGSLPTDPVNRYLTCGRCSTSRQPCADASECSATETCEPTDPGLDPATCWNADTQRYSCPRITDPSGAALPTGVSRVYQYRAVNGGSRYELATELEGPNSSRYVPPLLTEIKKCSNINSVCSIDTDCTVRNTAGIVTSSGTCNGTGGIWNYGGVCTGREYGADDVCGNGVIGPTEACELGDSRSTACTVGGSSGTKIQYCSDCRGFVDTVATSCVANQLCGNARIDRAQCDSGFKYGQACTTDSDCQDARNPSGTTPTCAPFATPEVCDDGALNGTYGRCNRTCSGFDVFCGDSHLSPGESCDQGPLNGAYCVPGTIACPSVSASCGFDCNSRAPFCGDSVTNGPEQCDGNTQRAQSAICSSGTNTGEPCTTDTDCGTGGSCGGTAVTTACAPKLLCTNDRDRNGRLDDSCTDDASCTRYDLGIAAETGTCISRETQHTRGCYTTTESAVDACKWKTWSACEPVGFCGNGIREAGEECDDGNTNNNDACTSQCKPNVCGDGFRQNGVEECDYGSRNGTRACVADYGSTCASCSTSCRQVASSGGFCGNGIKEGPEQCDGTEGLAGVSCRGLGYDYAQTVQCARRGYLRRISTGGVETVCSTTFPCRTCSGGDLSECDLEWVPPNYTPTNVPGDDADRLCLPDPVPCTPGDVCHRSLYPARQDVIQCDSSCGFNGCKRCVDTPGTGEISGQVRDAIYSNQPVPNARVTLFSRGVRVGEVNTNGNGEFTFNTINQNAACTNYRIIIDSYTDNPCTGTTSGRPGCNGQDWPSDLTPPDESVNGGYWSFESKSFAYSNFREAGLGDRNGNVYLAPRVGRGETLVVYTWNGALPGLRFLDAHLLLPSIMRSSTRTGDVYYDYPGNPDITTMDPHGYLACFHPNGSSNCRGFDIAPESIKYKRGDWAVTGNYAYYVVDYDELSALAEGTWAYKDAVSSTVRIVTEDHLYSVTPPTTRPTDPGCRDEQESDFPSDGKYWLVFTQSAGGGAITIPGGGKGLLLCNGSDIYGKSPMGPVTLPGPLQMTSP